MNLAVLSARRTEHPTGSLISTRTHTTIALTQKLVKN
jgi:hypothetical protein